MILESVGFVDVKVEVDENIFHQKHYEKNSYRHLNAVFITAKKGKKTDNRELEKKIKESTFRM
ncbi:hypothetical protein OAE14_01405 [Alphaproteobacteria bacterium]|nr:hypothetical protein [Alphaproteobacteria bacterium]